MTIADLPTHWRGFAADLRPFNEAVATAFERCAAQLDAAIAEAKVAPLSFAEAAAESGFSRSHLGRLLKEGRLTNLGTKRRPLVMRAELPRKASDPNPMTRIGHHTGISLASVRSHLGVASGGPRRGGR